MTEARALSSPVFERTHTHKLASLVTVETKSRCLQAQVAGARGLRTSAHTLPSAHLGWQSVGGRCRARAPLRSSRAAWSGGRRGSKEPASGARAAARPAVFPALHPSPPTRAPARTPPPSIARARTRPQRATRRTLAPRRRPRAERRSPAIGSRAARVHAACVLSSLTRNRSWPSSERLRPTPAQDHSRAALQHPAGRRLRRPRASRTPPAARQPLAIRMSKEGRGSLDKPTQSIWRASRAKLKVAQQAPREQSWKRQRRRRHTRTMLEHSSAALQDIPPHSSKPARKSNSRVIARQRPAKGQKLAHRARC